MLPSQFEAVAVQVPELDNSRLDAICAKYGIKALDFYTMDIEELGIIAKHRILPTPSLLLLNKAKVVVRLVGADIPKLAQFDKMIELLTHIYTSEQDEDI